MNTANTSLRLNRNGSGNAIGNAYRQTQNTVQQGYRRFQGLSTVAQVFSLLITLAVLGLIVWFAYEYWWLGGLGGGPGSPMIISSPVNAFGDDIERNKPRLPDTTQGLAFTYSFWIYIADWQYNFGKTKTVFVKGDANNQAPGVYLYPNKNSMAVRLSTFAMPEGEGCDIDNVPLQKWVHMGIILDNRTVDIYVDGKLERSCVMRGVPKLNKSPLQFGSDGGFYGQLSRMQYFNRALNANDIHDIYQRGPN